MMKEFIVYEGPEFTIEWYYNERGKSPAKIYFDQLNRERKLEAFELFMTIAKIGKILNITKFRYEGNNIYAFKPKPDRFLCFFILEKKSLSRMLLKKSRISCHLLKRKKP